MKFGKNSNIIKKEFNSEPAHDKKHLKAKKKKTNTEDVSQCICTQVILIDLVYRKDEN